MFKALIKLAEWCFKDREEPRKDHRVLNISIHERQQPSEGQLPISDSKYSEFVSPCLE